MAFPVLLVLYLVGGLLCFALALLLLVAHRRHWPNMLLSAFVLVAGTSVTLVAALEVVEDPTLRGPMTLIQQSLVLSVPLLLFLFVAAYPEERRGGPWPASVSWGVAALLVVTLVAYFLDFRRFKDHSAANLVLSGQPSWGVLFYAVVVLESLIPVAALLLLRDATRLPAGPRRNALHVVSLGVLLITPISQCVNDALFFTFDPLGRAWALDRVTSSVGGAVFVLNQFLGTATVGAVLGYAIAHAVRSPDADLRRRMGWYAACLGGVIAVGFVLGRVLVLFALPLNIDSLTGALRFAAAPVLLGYAVLRHQMYAVDVRIRWTVGRSAVAGTMVTGAVGVVTVVQALFPDVSETAVWVGLTTLAAVLQGPLTRLAERIAAAVVPESPEAADAQPDAGTVYARLVARFWRDDGFTRTDRGLLADVRRVAGVDEADALRIEDRVVAAPAENAATA